MDWVGLILPFVERACACKVFWSNGVVACFFGCVVVYVCVP